MTEDSVFDPRDCENRCREILDCNSFRYCRTKNKCHFYDKRIHKDAATKNEGDCYTTYMVRPSRYCKSNTFYYHS